MGRQLTREKWAMISRFNTFRKALHARSDAKKRVLA